MDAYLCEDILKFVTIILFSCGQFRILMKFYIIVFHSWGRPRILTEINGKKKITNITKTSQHHIIGYQWFLDFAFDKLTEDKAICFVLISYMFCWGKK